MLESDDHRIADRSSLVWRSALLAWFAIGWNTIEGLVAIAATAGRRRQLTVTRSWAWGRLGRSHPAVWDSQRLLLFEVAIANLPEEGTAVGNSAI